MGEIIYMGNWDNERMRKESEKRRQQMESSGFDEEQNRGGGGGGEVPPSFVQECLDANYLGDGMLFAYLQTGRFLYNHNTGEWLQWTGHHWQLDNDDTCKLVVEDLVPHYLAECARLDEKIAEAQKDERPTKSLLSRKKKIISRIDRLRSSPGRSAALEFAATCKSGIGIDGSMLDQNKWLFPVKNGVIDLKTGRFRPGRPDDYMTKASPIEWQGMDAPRKNFEAFLWDILEDREKIDFLQRWFGYGLTGDITEQKFLCLTGEGRNGKGILCEIVSEVMGDFGGPIRAEMLMDQGRVQSSSGPSSDVMDLQGMRQTFASESDEGKKFSPSKIKWYTGGDTLIGRYPHDKRQTAFTPTQKLTLQTNNRPHAPSDDFAFWERLLEVYFPYRFVDKPQADFEKKRDNRLMQRLREELPGILAWLVEGALLWQRDALAVPDVILDQVANYRREEDIVADWIEERCHVGDGSILTPSTQLYEDFADWFKNYQGARVPSGTWFGRRMSKKFDKTKEHGVNHYVGIGLLAL